MKKSLIIISVLVLALSFSTVELKAESTGMDLYLNGGVVTDDSLSFDPFLWTAGLNLDIHFGNLMLSPECFITVYKFKFDPLWLQPAVIANIKLSSFFVGAGLTKWFLIGDDNNFSTDIALKLNAGFRGNNFRLAVFAVTAFDDLFKNMTVGATFGISF
jgi:hypothetical protein